MAPPLEPKHDEHLDPVHARELLRRLRDLNLNALLAVGGGRLISIEGCLSIGHPIDEELRYLLNVQGREECVLSIAWESGSLILGLSDAETRDRTFRLETPLLRDARGRATAPELRARLDPESTNRREVEHFLRRVVRRAFAA